MKFIVKNILKWFGTFVLCFVVIYLVVFFGGWQLFNSGDPILIEIGVALVLSLFLFIINEVISSLEKRVKVLEERINELETK